MASEADGILAEEVERIAQAAGAAEVAVAFHDFQAGRRFDHGAQAWFHAASTIKIPVLIGVFAAAEEGDVGLGARVHVRNRFFSAAGGIAYRVDSARDAGGEVHQQVGKTMRVLDLARQMIVTSSNLATNLLIELLGLERIRATLERFGVQGVELRRGVEDERAFEAGISNEVTAAGLVQVLRLIEEGEPLSAESRGQMLEILHDQTFRSGIPAGVPEGTRVANKTGEISTVAHDAGLVYPPAREPYALAILTRWENGGGGRRETLAALSKAVYAHLSEPTAS